MSENKFTKDRGAEAERVTLDAPPPGIDMAAVPLEIDVPSAPSIPAGEAPDRPTPPEAPIALPPAAPPPSGQVPELETEPASLEPPEAVAAEPMAPAPRDGGVAEVEGRSSLPFQGLEPSPHVLPEPVVARQLEEEAGAPAPTEPTVLVETPTSSEFEPAPTPVPVAGGSGRGETFHDSVTLLEITPPESGGAMEAALPGDRSSSPPSPLPARRLGWNHPVARWTAYVLVVVALTLILLWLIISLFRIA